MRRVIESRKEEVAALLSTSSQCERLANRLSPDGRAQLEIALKVLWRSDGDLKIAHRSGGEMVVPHTPRDPVASSIVQAFDRVLLPTVSDLPLDRYLHGVPTVEDGLEHALAKVQEFEGCSPQTKQLFRWGLTPLTVQEAIVAVSRVAEWRFSTRPNLEELRILGEDEDVAEPSPTVVARELLVREVMRATD
jgi:hypothetical protein